MINRLYPFPAFDYHDPRVIRPVHAGHEWVTDESYRWDNRRMGADSDYYFIQYTVSGRGVFRFRKKEWRLDPGCAFLCTQDHPFEYFFDKKLSDHWEFLWLGMRGTMGLSLFRGIQKEYGKVVQLASTGASIRCLREFLEELEHKSWHGFTQVSAAAYAFLLQLQEDLRNRSNRGLQDGLDDALSYIHEHFTEPLDVSVISPSFGYTREHFSRLFRKRKGISPGRYIQDLRLGKARELLRTTDLPLKTVAAGAGLNSANYLCRQFKRKLDMTPWEYKQSLDAAVGGGSLLPDQRARPR